MKNESIGNGQPRVHASRRTLWRTSHGAEKWRIEQPHLAAGCGRGLFPRSIKPPGGRFYRTFARRSVTHLLSPCGCLSSQVSALRLPLPGQGRHFPGASVEVATRIVEFPSVALSARGRCATECTYVSATTLDACVFDSRVSYLLWSKLLWRDAFWTVSSLVDAFSGDFGFFF